MQVAPWIGKCRKTDFLWPPFPCLAMLVILNVSFDADPNNDIPKILGYSLILNEIAIQTSSDDERTATSIDFIQEALFYSEWTYFDWVEFTHL